MSKLIIKCEEVSKHYGAEGDASVYALKNINLTIQQGEYLALCGPSGSGKSSLMHILGCLDRASSGKYFLDGEEVGSMDLKTLALIRNQKIGFVFQQFFMMPHMSILDNVALPLLFRGERKSIRQEKAKEWLKHVGLDAKLHKKPHELSGGQRQRVVIARALITDPQLILADEPTGNLDTDASKVVIELFESFVAASRTLILVTHDPSLAKRAKRVIYLLDGEIRKDENKL